MWKPVAALILVCAFAAPAQAACTMIGCVDGLSINLDPSYQWLPGNYSFSLVIDGRISHCTAKLPLPACGDERAVTCDNHEITIVESGCALPPGSQGFGPVMISSSPKSVALTITRNGLSVLDRRISPQYSSVQPNGPMCGPVCRSATIELY
jgi:hypothetical protein